MAQRANKILDLAMDLATIEEKIAHLRRDYDAKVSEMTNLLKEPGVPINGTPAEEKVEAIALPAKSGATEKGKRIRRVRSKRIGEDGRHPNPKKLSSVSRRMRKILDVMYENPTAEVNVTELYERLDAKDRSKQGALRADLNKLHRADYVRWVCRGTYRLPPSGAHGTLQSGAGPHQIMMVMRTEPEHVWTVPELEARLKDLGREAIYKATKRLQKQGIVTRMGRGQYRLIQE